MRRTTSLGQIQFSDLTPFLGEERRRFVFDDVEYNVKMSSVRYQLFSNARSCCVCGIEGTILSLDSCPGTVSPHFNLYAMDVEGAWVLMTRDPVNPRSKGGLDVLENLRVMCEPYNARSNKTEMAFSDILDAREHDAKMKKVKALRRDENPRLTEEKAARRAERVR